MAKKSKNQLKKIDKANLLLQKQVESFDKYYSSFYGEDRWMNWLKPALLARGKHVALLNPHVDRDFGLKVLNATEDTEQENRTVPYLANYIQNVYIRESHLHPKDAGTDTVEPVETNDDKEEKVIEKDANFEIDGENENDESTNEQWPSPNTCLGENGLSPYYPLDAASLLPVLLLGLEPDHTVLDLCAAPGGKSLAISQQLNLVDGRGFLQCNDVSPNRRIRLLTVLKRYLPEDCLASTNVSLGDAMIKRFGRLFDRILIDAPCSSERHLLYELQHSKAYHPDHIVAIQAKQFMSWSENRCKTNAERQLALLLNGVVHCRDQGRLVYSTCALSPLENDVVIDKLRAKLEKRNKKHKEEQISIEVEPASDLPFGEATEGGGWQILPDNNELGWGPIYCIVLKVNRSE